MVLRPHQPFELLLQGIQCRDLAIEHCQEDGAPIPTLRLKVNRVKRKLSFLLLTDLELCQQSYISLEVDQLVTFASWQFLSMLMNLIPRHLLEHLQVFNPQP